MKKRFFLILSLLAAFGFSAFAERGNVTIIYTNDIHSYINKNISFASVSAYKKELQTQGKNVVLVDSGDEIQGTAYGSMDKGESIIQLMNKSSYDVATIGNHEFDYGTPRLMELVSKANFPYVSCNFYRIKKNQLVFKPYVIKTVCSVKIAFIGITTPETITGSTPLYFADPVTKKMLYKISSGSNGKQLYKTVQKTINQALKEADYVVALSHLGDAASSTPWRSLDVIQNTYGLDAVIDGHSHSVVPQMYVKNSRGKDVLLTQTGCFFDAFGKMELSADSITSELIKDYSNKDSEVTVLEKILLDKIDEKFGEKIAVSDIDFYIMDPAAPEKRIVRRQETNLADLNADAFYYYLNFVEGMNCDFVIMNGGGVRVNLPKGELSYNSVKSVNPFGNVVCLVKVTGRDILDALEFGTRFIESSEFGGFPHVAGLKYTVDTSVPSKVRADEGGMWISGPQGGKYRISDVQIYNKAAGKYEPLDLEKTYDAGGLNYILRNSGNGYKMFASSDLVKDYIGEDYMIFSDYLRHFKSEETSGLPHINSKNSPLSVYSGYFIDYENPYGSGRITIK